MDGRTTKASLSVKQMPSPIPLPDAPRWRLLRTPPLDGAANMALDDALMRRAAETGEWVLRTYAWRTPTLSLGRNQQARGRYDLARLRAEGIPVVRRPTGGRAILHDREVTYSVTAPLAAAGSLGASYARINRLLVRGLESLGVPVEVAPRSAPALAPGVAPCFALPAAGELVHDGRKLAGSAQWRDESALLQHGSILLEGDQSLVAALLLEPAPPPPPPATLRDALDRPPRSDEVADALEHAVRTLEDPHAEPLAWDADLERLASARRPFYEAPAWTWRR
jgi:lipoate-protein ligase A